MKSDYWCRKVMMAVILLLGMGSTGAGAETPGSWARRADLGVAVQDFKWAEYGDRGNKVLEETGNLFGVFCDIESRERQIGWRCGGNFFFGQVDYDGQTWTNIPVTTDVLYVGSKVFADAGPGIRLDSGLWFKAFLGLGAAFWLRDLDDTRTPDGDPVNGAREWWGYLYGRAGFGAEFPVTEDILIFAEAGLKLPIYARNEAEFFLSDSPSVGLEPEPEVSGFGAAGGRWKQWGARITYDALRFDRSDTVSAGFYSLYQPRSESDVYSVEVFWSKGF